MGEGAQHGAPVLPPQAQVTKLGEEMSLRFLKREAKLCGFLQKSFLALEKVGAGSWWGSAVSPAPGSQQWTGLSQRMKASESTRLKVESSLREELESRWHNLQELAEERLRALRAQCKVGSSGWAQAGRLVGHRSQATSVLQQEECYLLEQCRGLDRAVVQLTRFVRQNQVSLNRVLLAEQKGRWVSKRGSGQRTREVSGWVGGNGPSPWTPASWSQCQAQLGAWQSSHAPSACPSRGTRCGSDGRSPVLVAPVTALPSSAPVSVLEGSGASSQAPLPGPAPRGGPASAEGQSLSVAPTPRDTKGHLEESQAGELAAYFQENMEAMQLASEQAQQETQSTLELVRAAGAGSGLLAGSPTCQHPHSAPPPTAPREEAGLGGVGG